MPPSMRQGHSLAPHPCRVLPPELWDGSTTCHLADCLSQVAAHHTTPPRRHQPGSGGAILSLQKCHSSQGMNVTPALPGLGTATCCPSDKHHWPQEVETCRALGVTLLPGHQEGRCCGLHLRNPELMGPGKSTQEEAAGHTDSLENTTSPSPYPTPPPLHLVAVAPGRDRI